jgi:hypothetical protein
VTRAEDRNAYLVRVRRLEIAVQDSGRYSCTRGGPQNLPRFSLIGARIAEEAKLDEGMIKRPARP